MKDQPYYYDMKDKTKEPTFFFMLNCVLLTRVNNGLESDDNQFEQEINVYLANLLTAFANPSYIERLRPYLSEHDIEVFRRLEGSTDARLKYTVYKANADFLLFSIGVFDSAGEELLPLGPEFRHGHQGQMGKAQSYYHFAFSYSKRLPAVGDTVAEVLEQLSKGFEKYVTILTYLRGEYFDIVKRISDGEIYHLNRSVEAAGKRMELRKKQNEFLDAYMDWKNRGTGESKGRVISIAEELRCLDPAFTYKPAQQLRNE
ncbi:MAG: hypothetical protein ABIJ00_14260 [Candidatus Eisenbacteria bacterium]